MNKSVKLFSRDVEALKDVKSLIGKNLDEMPSIKQLCRKSGLNEDKLKRGFKQLFGMPPYRYHIIMKMEEAKRLLLETEMPVYNIAWSLGYQHSANFCIEFKKFTGERPSGFREHKK